MLSIRARIALKVIGKQFNINPFECKDPIAHVQRMNGPDRYKAPKGFFRYKEKLSNAAVEFVKPAGEKPKRLIYIIHGGAYIAGLTDLYRKSAKRYSKAGGGAEVAFLDYRVAPAHYYPAALDDALEGWELLLKKGYEEKDITVIGDSAGGNLTLALMLKLKELGKALPGKAVVMSPWADMTASGESYLNNFNRDVMFGGKNELSKDMVETFLKSPIFSYFGDADRKNPLVSPVFGDYSGFPKTLFTVGGDEILLSDTLTIKEKMDKAGVETELIIGEKMFHVWPVFYMLLPESEKAMKAVCDFISK